MMQQTLLAVGLGLCACLVFLLCLPGFVPQVEGPEVRRVVQNVVVRLTEDDLPKPIECFGDGQRLWSYRGNADLTTTQREISPTPSFNALRFLGHSVVLFVENTPIFCTEDRDQTLVPVLALDGITMPHLVVALPSAYADILESNGAPIRWYRQRTLQSGYTPVQLRRQHNDTADEAEKPKDAEEHVYPRPIVLRVTIYDLLRAVDFQPLVRIYANRFGLDVNLVNAIILSESDFRTTLISRRSAVGLMQVLPRTARVDIHRFLHGIKGNITSDDLIDPETNILYGTCYLHMLMQRFSGVVDPRSREYCAIAAYNSGPGRIVRLFGESTAEAAAAINEMPSEAVYDALTTRLPYEETRIYLAKVRSTLKQYADLDLP